MEALDELVKRDLVLLISEFRQLLHSAISLITLQYNSIEQLSHQEEVVDFAAKYVLEGGLFRDLELSAFSSFI